jgi:predicted porin
MKKSLLALGALGTFAGVAAAQSSVTLYGIIDQGLMYQSNSRTVAANPATGNPGMGGAKYTVDGNAGQNGTRWGIKGVEDLGGGLSALFQLENGFNINTGGFNQGGLEFGRQAFMGLKSAQFGTVTLGRQYDSVVDYIGPYIFADKIAPSLAAHAGDVDNANNSQRVNNAIKYTSNTYNGLSFGGLYSLGGVAGSTGRNQIYSLGAGYKQGPLGLGAAFLKVDQPNSSFFSNSAAAAGSLAAGGTSVTNPIYSGYVNANSYQVASVGGSYTIGPAELGATYSNTEFRNLQSGLSGLAAGTGGQGAGGVGTAVFNTYELSLVWHLSPALQLGGAYAFTKTGLVQNAAGTAFGGAKYNTFALSTDYALSKRTDVYLAGVYQTASGTDSTGNAASADLAGLTQSSNNHQAAVRVALRHRF